MDHLSLWLGISSGLLLERYKSWPQNARARIDQIAIDLGWPLRRLNLAVCLAEAQGWVVLAESGLVLTQKVYAYARESAEKFCVFS